MTPKVPASPFLTPLQIFEYMRKAHFPSALATTMTAIALRESGGDPLAFNDNEKTGDRSYGLLQINMLGPLLAPRLALFGLADASELFDPATNCRAGFLLWNHDNKNLDACWYISRDVYRLHYELHLPAAQAAALASPLGL